MTAHEAFQAGRLDEAIALATEAVRNKPTDTDARSFLATLFCFVGDWERADKQLDTVMIQNTELVLGVSLVRQLVRAAQARDEFFSSGRLPEFISDPPEHAEISLRASIELREGKLADAARLLARAEKVRPDVRGTHNGKKFVGIRDLDDQLSGVCEVLTSTGKYYHTPFERIRLIEFKHPETPLDLLWRQAHIVVENGPHGDVYIPAIYHDRGASCDSQLRLGRATDWIGEHPAPILGVGQRMLLVGDEDLPIMSLGKIETDLQDGDECDSVG